MVVRVGNKFPEFNGAPASSIEVSSSYSFQAASGTHYIVMKAVDWAGNESGYSPEQVAVVP